jgi:hypothetical protein
MHKYRSAPVVFLLALLALVKPANTVGSRGPLYCGGSGKAMLAYISPGEQERVLAQPLVPLTPILGVVVCASMTTPEMVVARFGVMCSPKTGEPVRLVHSRTTMFRLMGNKYVQDSDEPLSPPRDVSLDSHHDFAAKPAGVACERAVAMLKKSH